MCVKLGGNGMTTSRTHQRFRSVCCKDGALTVLPSERVKTEISILHPARFGDKRI